MRARQLESLLSTLGGLSASDLEVRTTRLRARGLLPKGGRGLHAPEIGPEHAATILIAVGAASRAVDAGDMAARYYELFPPAQFAACCFREDLIRLLDDVALAGTVEHVRICRTWPEASITITQPDGSTVETVYRRRDPQQSERCIREDVTFSGALIHQLAFNLMTGGAGVAYQE